MMQMKNATKANRRSTLRTAILAVALTAGGLTSAAMAQDSVMPKDLLDDFNHFTRIARPDLAAQNAQALLSLGLTPTDFVDMLESDPALSEAFDAAYLRATRIPELTDLAKELNSLFEEGKRQRARNPEEIAKNIELLAGNSRGRFIGRARLKEAGEYAVPQLLEILIVGNDLQRGAEVRSLLAEMGPDAIKPLAAALFDVPASVQEQLCVILGNAGYQTALPYLYQLAETTSNGNVRSAADQAISRIDASGRRAGVNAAWLFTVLANDFMSEAINLTSFEGERHQLQWEYIPELGLNPTAIYTEVYHEAEAMRLAERALTLDPENSDAVTIWLHANFRREIQQPEGYDNPVYGMDERSPMFYAVAAGATPVQRLLARAMAEQDTLTARKAIEALNRSAPSAGLWSEDGGESPLVSAMTYPDRRVRYDAALALGASEPSESFPGASRVVPLIAGIVRDAGVRYAVILTASGDRDRELRSVLEGQGYTVVAPARAMDDIRSEVETLPGIDLIVTDYDGDAGVETIDALRAQPRLKATPVLALMTFEDVGRYTPRYRSRPLTRLLAEGASSNEFGNAVSSLVSATSGEPLDDAAARAYSRKALAILHTLAISKGSILDVREATPALISSLEVEFGEVQLDIARVLSRVGEARAQVAVMDAAMDNFDQDRINLLALVTDSVRRFGNKLEERQVRRLIEVVEDGIDEEATAAGALLGALDLPSSRIVPLILDR